MLLFLLSAGFAKLMATCVNWLCSRPFPKYVVIADKGLNLILIAAYPLMLVFGHRIAGARFLSDPMRAGLMVWSLILLGVIGFVLLVWSTIDFWRYAPPRCEIAVETKLIDLRDDDQSWRETLVGSKEPMRRVALLPGNQQFSLEVATKAYCLDALPGDWDGLSIVLLSDFHFANGVARKYFEIVCEHAAALQPDLFVFSGDLLDVQKRTEWLPDTLGRLRAPLGQYFILGNHDWYHDVQATRREFVQSGWVDISSRSIQLPTKGGESSSPLVLCGDETPWMGTHPDLSKMPPEAFRILLSHGPDNIPWARQNGFHLMLAGHTHGGQIRLPILGPVYSPSRFGCQFSSGVFWLEPTLMYVSRGVSGREPIRFNCPPELTKLVLRPGKSSVPHG